MLTGNLKKESPGHLLLTDEYSDTGYEQKTVQRSAKHGNIILAPATSN